MPKPLHILVNLLAITAITFLSVDIGYRVVRSHLWPEQGRQGPAARPAAFSEPGGKRAAASHEALLKRNLFGAAAQSAKGSASPAQADIKNLEPTALQLRLLGTIAGGGDSGRAVIEDLKLKTQGLYRVGDEIQSARIKQILRGKVVLATGARDEILSMAEKPAGEKSAAQAAARVKPTGTPGQRPTAAARPRVAAPARPQPAAARVEPAGTLALDREELGAALDNLGDILTQARVQPVVEEDNSTGLQVSEIRPDSIFSRLGLKDGDVVEAVNDKQIEGPDDIISLYQGLKAGSRLNLRISRGGQQEVLNYNIR